MLIDESSCVRTKYGTADISNLVGGLRLLYTSNVLLTREEMREDIYEHKDAILSKLREVKPVRENVLEGLVYEVHQVNYFTERDTRDLRGHAAGRFASLDSI